jgi:predicted RNA-binding Zn-ribbon protein involved in translation (DUF1610 family)
MREPVVMSALVFSCPQTGCDIVSGISTDLESLSHVQHLPVSLFCPHCGKVHRLAAKDGRLAATPLPKPGRAHVARV